MSDRELINWLDHPPSPAVTELCSRLAQALDEIATLDETNTMQSDESAKTDRALVATADKLDAVLEALEAEKDKSFDLENELAHLRSEYADLDKQYEALQCDHKKQAAELEGVY